jgi:hypothetical protein
MSDTEIVLFAGCDGDEEGEGYAARVALDHDAKRNELYVIVGEEAAGMAEGVSATAFEAIRKLAAPSSVREGLTLRLPRHVVAWLRDHVGARPGTEEESGLVYQECRRALGEPVYREDGTHAV